jgi:GNAT superfamily N-acetyltransferase
MTAPLARATTTHLRRLGPADLPALLALQRAATEDLPDGFFRLKDEAALGPYLDGTYGLAYGIVEAGTLCAAALVSIPDATHPNPESNPPFPIVPDPDWPCHAAFLESAMVHPDARGRGSQRSLLKARIAHAGAVGMRWACSGANLRNQVSWANLLRCGFVLGGLIERRGRIVIGLARALGPTPIATDRRDRAIVPAQDAALHRAALRAGFVGVRIVGASVIYQRRAASLS